MARRRFCWIQGGTGAAVLYSVVVGAVREFWVKTNGSDSLFASIPIGNTFQAFVGKENALIKNEMPTRSIKLRLIAQAGAFSPNTASGLCKFTFYVPLSVQLLGITSDSISPGRLSITNDFDPDSFTIEDVDVPGLGVAPVRAYYFYRTASTSEPNYVERVTLTVAGSAYDLGLGAFTSGATFAMDPPVADVGADISMITMQDPQFPVGMSGMSAESFSDSSGTVLARYTWTNVVGGGGTAIFPNGGGPGLEEQVFGWASSLGTGQTWLRDGDAVYQSTFYGSNTTEGTEYFPGDEIPGTEGDWRASIVNYEISSSVSTGDSCLDLLLLDDDGLLDNGLYFNISLSQVIAGQTLRNRLETSPDTVNATLTTQSATSGATCTLGTPQESTVQVPSPGRGTVEGITYLP